MSSTPISELSGSPPPFLVSQPPKWVTETASPMWPGQQFSLESVATLTDETSPYQTILAFESASHGKVLVLDGVIQFTERDEFSYHEMMVHVAMNVHPNPKRVLIVGAGDGGVTREVLKHGGVERVVQVEIDEQVVNVCKKHFRAHIAGAYEDPRVQLFFEDGNQFLRIPGFAEVEREQFDVAIVDSSDPLAGPNSSLFTADFYALVRAKLRGPHAVAVFQAENAWLHARFIREMRARCEAVFPSVRYGYVSVPTYPGGQIGFLLCGVDPKLQANAPLRHGRTYEGDNYSGHRAQSEAVEAMKFKYYSAHMHTASFVLPAFCALELGASRPPTPSHPLAAASTGERHRAKEDFLSGLLGRPSNHHADEPLNDSATARHRIALASLLLVGTAALVTGGVLVRRS